MYKPDSSFNVLYTSDVVSTYEFYKAIGATITQFENDKVVLSLGNFGMHFVLETKEPFEDYKYIAENHDRGMGIIFYIEVDDIEAYYQLIENSGGKIKARIFSNMWEAKELLFEDPNGYKIALYQMN
ncbi:MAG: VOC family protein [Candidatus Dojkabacteria bacterium]